jgi:predicted phage terminase large subunit-like protein
MLFAMTYLPQHFRLNPSRMHKDLFTLVRNATSQRNARIAVAAPRGHAKTTVVSLAYVLWCVLYGHERFVLIVSATREQAVQLLTDIKRELEENALLREDFPEVCAPVRRPGITWKSNHVVLANKACIRVLGAGQQLRGLKHGADRPTLIIGDDLEELESVFSSDQRKKTLDWFERTLLKAGSTRTNVIVIGTILHYDSLLARLVQPSAFAGQRERSGWDSHLYRAVERPCDHPELWDEWEAIRNSLQPYQNETGLKAAEVFFDDHQEKMLDGAEVLWPESEDYLRLMTIRADEGRASFQSEKQNDPLDPEECMFREDNFRYWDDEYSDVDELIAAVGSSGKFFVACDPSMGKRPGRGDYTAIVTILKDTKSNTMYVIGADLKRCKPDQMIESIVHLVQMYPIKKFGFESNQFQEVLADQVERRVRKTGNYMRVEKLKTTANKQSRIEGLEPLIRQGRLRFCRRHQMLLDQLRQFPLGAHDDGPDALEMAVTLAVTKQYTVTSVQI